MKIVLTGVWRYVIKGWELICRAELPWNASWTTEHPRGASLLDQIDSVAQLHSHIYFLQCRCSICFHFTHAGKHDVHYRIMENHPLLCLCRWKLLYLQPSAVMNTRWLKCNYVSLFMHSSCRGCYNEPTCCICTIFYGVFERSNTLWKPYKTQPK